jgi:hypothetical protein
MPYKSSPESGRIRWIWQGQMIAILSTEKPRWWGTWEDGGGGRWFSIGRIHLCFR